MGCVQSNEGNVDVATDTGGTTLTERKTKENDATTEGYEEIFSKRVEFIEENSNYLFGFRMGYSNNPYQPSDKLVGLSDNLYETSLLLENDDKKCDIELNPTVKALHQLIQNDGTVRRFLSQAIEEVKIEHSKHPKKVSKPLIDNIGHLLLQLNELIKSPPIYPSNTFPMSNLFGQIAFTDAGYVLFTLPSFNNMIAELLKVWCDYLNSQDSRKVLTDKQSLSKAAIAEFKLNEFEIDFDKEYGGFDNYNSFFHRQIKLEYRKLSGVNDDSIIVSPNDGHIFNVQFNIKKFDQFWLKGYKYSLFNLLNGQKKYIETFLDGTIIQVYLSGANYHRWRSPISGTIIEEPEIINGLMFAELPFTKDDQTAPSGDPTQVLEACQNTRGMAVIEADNPKIGKVIVVPVGMCEVSSIFFSKSKGDHVDKGEEFGYFSFGGSSIAVLYEKNVIKQVYGYETDANGKRIEYKMAPNDPQSTLRNKEMNVREKIALANV